MVAIMDANLDSGNIYNFVAVDVEGVQLSTGRSSESVNVDDCFNQFDDEMCKKTAMVRTVAMSANIASTVKDEVKHLIRINTFESALLEDMDSGEEDSEGKKCDVLCMAGKTEGRPNSTHGTSSSCSHILPIAEENIISAIVLSKWDDIMGPQTVHVWLPEFSCMRETRSIDCSGESSSRLSRFLSGSATKSIVQAACSHEPVSQNLNLMKAIKYVTSHTVNYTGVNLSSSNLTYEERNSNIFVVPDLELVTQSLVFYVRCADLTAPFSLAVLVGHEHYTYFLHLRELCHQWLRRMAARLHDLLLKYISSSSGFESISIEKLNHWVLDLCETVISLGVCGLGTTTLACSANILNHPLLERALTSHLQTFGCTVIMGTSSTDINTIISLLALFLGTEERFCSRLMLPTMKYSFHVGLFLQGLLLDEFGCRELSSVELAANPYLVTAVDLTRGIHPSAVKQTPPRHLQRVEWEEPREGALHRSILHPVKESASLVKALLNDMKHLPPGHWQSFIDLFLKKVSSLAHTLLSLTHYLREDGLQRGAMGGAPLLRNLMWSMNLREGDFLIVLAAAEKLKPGVYSYVMELDACSR